MNIKFYAANLSAGFFSFLFGGILFFGCTQQTKIINGNAVVNNEPATVNKSITPTNLNTAADQNEEILWDFRKVSGEKPQRFSKAETDAVLKYVVGDNWDQDLAITSRVSGSFTKLNARETLYFVTGCEDENGKFVSNSTCGHVGWDSAGWIAIFDGTTPVLKTKQALGYEVRKVTDVNGDGINEILSCGGYGGMGIENESCTLGQISADKYQDLESFSGSADNCADSISKDKKAVASIARYKPTTGGKLPDFSEEYFQTECQGDRVGQNPQWKAITKKQFDDFSESIR